MTALLAAGTTAVVIGLVAAVAAHLWATGSMVEHIATVLSEQVAPGAREVAGHVSAMGTGAVRLREAVQQLTTRREHAR